MGGGDGKNDGAGASGANSATLAEKPPKLMLFACLGAIAFVIFELIMLALGKAAIANIGLAGLIGFVTGATELVARFKDRPLEAILSSPGMFYAGVNAFASGLALWLFNEWQLFTGQPAKQVMIAGFSAMAVLRTGLFTAKVGTQEVQFGPSLVLKVILDALDRAYDRSRANRRASLIWRSMNGVGFAQAKENLPELTMSLMQTVSGDEREWLKREVERVNKTELDDTVRAMSLGLILMNIVGEDTLRAAIDNLGGAIIGFTDLGPDLRTALAKRDPNRIDDHFFALCNMLSPTRAQVSAGRIEELKAKAAQVPKLEPVFKAQIIAHLARVQFGTAVVRGAIEFYPEVKIDPSSLPAVPEAPPGQ